MFDFIRVFPRQLRLGVAIVVVVVAVVVIVVGGVEA